MYVIFYPPYFYVLKLMFSFTSVVDRSTACVAMNALYEAGNAGVVAPTVSSGGKYIYSVCSPLNNLFSVIVLRKNLNCDLDF